MSAGAAPAGATPARPAATAATSTVAAAAGVAAGPLRNAIASRSSSAVIGVSSAPAVTVGGSSAAKGTAAPAATTTATPVATPTATATAGAAANVPDIRALYVFSNQKAGMSSVDKQKIDRVIFEMSKDSAHFANQQRKHANVTHKIERMRAKLAQVRSSSRVLAAAHQHAVARRVEKLVAELHAARPLHRTWIHIDMDMFYAAVEIRDRPELADKPVAVGGLGMISTSNYIARRFGVRAAMPGFIALKLCPQLVFVKHHGDKYKAVAEQTWAIYREYDPNFDAGSLDEAYLDVTDYLNAKNATLADSDKLTGSSVAAEIRARIFAATQLTASAGIGPNRMLSKMSGEINKPNGQYSIGHDSAHILQFMNALPVRRIPGIGQVMERVLREIGFSTCADVRNPDHAAVLFEMFTEPTARWLIEASLGLGTHERSKEERERKSISTERTFREINTLDAFKARLRSLCQALAEDLAHHKARGKTVTLKLKNVKFHVIQRSVSVPRYIHTADDLYKYGLQLLNEELDRLTALRATAPAALHVSAADSDSPTASDIAKPAAAAAGTATAPVAAANPTAPAAATESTAAAAAAAAKPEPVLRLRLMGIRLSALHPDCDGHGTTGAARNGQTSIAKFFGAPTSAAAKPSSGVAAGAGAALSSPVKPPVGSAAVAAAGVTGSDGTTAALRQSGSWDLTMQSTSIYAKQNRLQPRSQFAASQVPAPASAPAPAPAAAAAAAAARTSDVRGVVAGAPAPTPASASVSAVPAPASASAAATVTAIPASAAGLATTTATADDGEGVDDDDAFGGGDDVDGGTHDANAAAAAVKNGGVQWDDGFRDADAGVAADEYIDWGDASDDDYNDDGGVSFGGSVGREGGADDDDAEARAMFAATSADDDLHAVVDCSSQPKLAGESAAPAPAPAPASASAAEVVSASASASGAKRTATTARLTDSAAPAMAGASSGPPTKRQRSLPDALAAAAATQPATVLPQQPAPVLLACPVCGRHEPWSNAQLNAHLDQCLGGGGAPASSSAAAAAPATGAAASAAASSSKAVAAASATKSNRKSGKKPAAASAASGPGIGQWLKPIAASAPAASAPPAPVNPPKPAAGGASPQLPVRPAAAAAASARPRHSPNSKIDRFFAL